MPSDTKDAVELEKIVNEEYKTWKKNAPFLYDLVVSNALDWPSLTVQWFPDIDRPEGKNYTVQRLLLGTQTSGAETNYLTIAHVQIPVMDLSSVKYDEERGEYGGYGAGDCKFIVAHRIPHDGDVNRARYMPQNPDLIATKTVSGKLYVFDRTKHPLQPTDGKCRPDIILEGHSREGYGVSWNPNASMKGHIISGAEDTLVCYWDVNAYSKESKTLQPMRTFKGHTDVVEDVAWHWLHDRLFASVGDDSFLHVWDTRSESDTQPAKSTKAHNNEVNTVAFHPSCEYLLVTGSSDHTLKLWDLRSFREPLHTFEGHQDDVLQVSWSPHNQTILASASADRRVSIWDLSRIGDEQTPEDAEDGPPELLFMHGGHTNRVADLSWNLNEPWVLASTAEDNICQIWQPARSIYVGDIDVDPMEIGEA